MNIVQADQVESNPASVHRGGKSFRQNLLGAKTGVENFPLVISRSEARFSPRHRHSFEQYRYQLEGIAEYGKSGTLKPGMLGYFPEGMHYGPQTPSKDGDNLVVLALQCGGASGSGYVNRDEQPEAAKELKKIGTFKDGVFHRNPGEPGKKNLDGSQAIWEHVMKKDLVFPKPRYAAPIFMHPEHFDWVPVDGSPGVAEKLMGCSRSGKPTHISLSLNPMRPMRPQVTGIFMSCCLAMARSIRKITSLQPLCFLIAAMGPHSRLKTLPKSCTSRCRISRAFRRIN